MPLTANGVTPTITASATFSEPPGINATATTPAIQASYTLTFQPKELVANVSTPAITASLTLSEGPKITVAAKTPAITALIGIATPIPISPTAWNTRVSHEMFSFGKSVTASATGRIIPYLSSALEVRQVGKLRFTMYASSAVTSAVLRVQHRIAATAVVVTPPDRLRFVSNSVLRQVQQGFTTGLITPKVSSVGARLIQSSADLRLTHRLLSTGPQISTGISVLARVTPRMSADGIGIYHHQASMQVRSRLIITGPATPVQGISVLGTIKNTLSVRGSRTATATMRVMNRVKISHGHIGIVKVSGRIRSRINASLIINSPTDLGHVYLRITPALRGYLAPVPFGFNKCLVVNTTTGEATQWLIPGIPVEQYIVGSEVSINSYTKTIANVTTDRIPSSTNKARLEYVYTMLDGKHRTIFNRAVTDSINREYNVRTTQTSGYSQNRSTFGMGVDGYELQAGFKVQTDSQLEVRALTVGISTLKRRL